MPKVTKSDVSTTNDEDKMPIRNNMIYRSLRRSSSRIALSLRKKVTTMHRSIIDRRALRPLNDDDSSPSWTPRDRKQYRFDNHGLLITPNQSPNINIINQQSTKQMSTTNDIYPRSALSPLPQSPRPNRFAKQLARCRIWDIQSPKRCGNRSINKCLQVEVNDLVNGLRQLDEISKSMSKIQ